MVGIYKDSFINYLKVNLGEPIKVTSKNIVCRCPFCETNKRKNHFHLWIDLRSPIWNCFHAGCPGKSGTINKLLKKIDGKDNSEKYIDKDKIKEYFKEKNEFFKSSYKPQNIITPDINENEFKLKEFYIRSRLKFYNFNLNIIKGLIFDVDKFIKINSIDLDETSIKLKNYLQTNFVGFLTENNSTVIFRNIDSKSTFKHFKLSLQENKFLDYYKISSNKNNEKTIVLGEGVFDILSEYIFDYLNLKYDVRLYASALSAKYGELIKSIIFHEQIFNPNVIIISDSDVKLNYYKILKNEVKFCIDKLIIFYNKNGKDFNVTPVFPEKFIL